MKQDAYYAELKVLSEDKSPTARIDFAWEKPGMSRVSVRARTREERLSEKESERNECWVESEKEQSERIECWWRARRTE